NLRVVNEGSLTVGLDTEVTEELSKEGDVRDLVRGVQNLRKESGFDVTDRIRLWIFGSDRLKDAWKTFADFVAGETLAIEVIWGEADGMIELEAEDEAWRVKVRKA
ncbi:MAG: DUF5915 domain-containing protein, partial [Treponemataceae bacterium]